MSEPAPKDDQGHVWHEKVFASMHLLCCMNCGFIKNPNKPNAKRPGPVAVEVRA